MNHPTVDLGALRCVKVLALVALLGAAGAAPAFATAVELGDESSCPAATEIVIPLRVNTSGDALQSLDASITFDDDNLVLVGVYKTAHTQDDYTLFFNVTPNGGGPDELDIALFTGTPQTPSPSDVIVELLFHVSGPPSVYALELDPAGTFINEQAVDTLDDGSIALGVADVGLRIDEDANGTPGEVVEVPIYADPGDDLSSFDITLDYNPAVVSVVGVATTPATADFFLTVNSMPGQLIFSLFDDVALPPGSGSVAIAIVSFEAVGNTGDETPLDLVSGTTDDGVTTCLDDGLFRICGDGDGDGFTSCPTDREDCDDAEEDVFPQAPQICDGLNNDCDDPFWPALDPASGAANEIDLDGDTYSFCAGDCNESDITIHPGATETCDTVDQDCDGQLDNAPADDDCDTSNVCRFDFCTPAGACAFVPSGSCGLAGTVYYNQAVALVDGFDAAKPVEGVEISVTGESAGADLTDVAGDYSVSPLAGDVVLDARRTADAHDLTALSSLDAAHIAQYAVELLDFSPRQQVVADVSNNGSINSFDAALVALKVVNPVTLLPAAVAADSDWAFFVTPQSFMDLSMDTSGIDLAGVVYGDVTLNWVPPPPASLSASTHPMGTGLQGSGAGTPAASGASSSGAPGPDLSPRAEAARLYLARVPRDLADGSREYVLGIDGADGIVSLDLDLAFDPLRVRVLEVHATGLGETLALVANTQRKLSAKVALWGASPLAGTGELLVIRARVARNVTGFPFKIEAQANEARIPLEWDLDLEPAESMLEVAPEKVFERRHTR